MRRTSSGVTWANPSLGGEGPDRVELAVLELWRHGLITAWRVPGAYDPYTETFQAAGVTPKGREFLDQAALDVER